MDNQIYKKIMISVEDVIIEESEIYDELVEEAMVTSKISGMVPHSSPDPKYGNKKDNEERDFATDLANNFSKNKSDSTGLYNSLVDEAFKPMYNAISSFKAMHMMNSRVKPNSSVIMGAEEGLKKEYLSMINRCRKVSGKFIGPTKDDDKKLLHKKIVSVVKELDGIISNISKDWLSIPSDL